MHLRLQDTLKWSDGLADKDGVQGFHSRHFHAVPAKLLQILVLLKEEWEVVME